MTTAGMWIHVALTIGVVMDGANTRNQIWGELRGVLASLPVFALWIVLDWRLP